MSTFFFMLEIQRTSTWLGLEIRPMETAVLPMCSLNARVKAISDNSWRTVYRPTKRLESRDTYRSRPATTTFPGLPGGALTRKSEFLWRCCSTMPGVPVLYYGSEIGMRFLPNTPEKEGANRAGIRAGSRTPMQWSAGENAGFSGAPAEDLYLPVDPDPDRPNVAAQQDRADSMLNFTRSLLKLRRE